MQTSTVEKYSMISSLKKEDFCISLNDIKTILDGLHAYVC